MSNQMNKAFKRALKRPKVVFVEEGRVPVGESLIRRAFKKNKSTVVFVEVYRIAPEETLFPEKLAMAKEMLSKIKFNDPRLRKLVE